MSEKISKRIFIGELVVIVLPLSLLLLIATSHQTYSTIVYSLKHNIAITIIALVSCIALLSGLMISKTFLNYGSSGLHELKPYQWILSFVGIIIPIASLISMLLPPSLPYSSMGMFRDDFHTFILGFPICIPYIHLILERLLRKDMSM